MIRSGISRGNVDGPTPTPGNKGLPPATMRRRQAALLAGAVVLAAGAGLAVGVATGATPAHASRQHLATSTIVKVAAVTIVTVDDPPKVPALRHVVTHPTTTAETTVDVDSVLHDPAGHKYAVLHAPAGHKHAVVHAPAGHKHAVLHATGDVYAESFAYAESVAVTLTGPDAHIAHDHP